MFRSRSLFVFLIAQALVLTTCVGGEPGGLLEVTPIDAGSDVEAGG